eukprot:g6366.t1
MSELDAFKGAEDTLGVTIWRIENFKPVKQPSSKTGHFASGKTCSTHQALMLNNTGDSYIVLNVFEKSGAKIFHIHFWLGKDTTKDESGTAAYLSASLDELLGGKPIQFREIQGEESDAFLQMFKNGVHYEEGGVSSGFKTAKKTEHKTRLLHIRGTRGVRIAEVPVEVASLNHGDCFVLDDGLELFQWNGKDANTAEKSKALSVTSAIKNDQRNGKAMIVILNDGDFTSENAKHFFSLLGASGASASSVKIASGISKEKEKLFQPAKLFKVDGGEFTEIPSAPGGFKKSELVDNALFILSSGGKIYIWIGKDVSSEVKKNAMKTGNEFLDKQSLPAKTQIQVMKQNIESPMFKGCFQQWEQSSLKEKISNAKTKEEKAEVDIGSMVTGLTEKLSKQLNIDDGSGKIEIWRIENFELASWPEDKYGQFYAGDSFLVKYTYYKSGVENCILYFWQGRDSSTDEKGAAALLAAKLDEEMGGSPVQVRVVQNKEPDDFHLIFKGSMIVHLGGLNNPDEGKEGPNGEKLYQVKGYSALDTHAVQVRTVASSLNSGDSFILINEAKVVIWQGKLCSDDERAFAASMASKLAEGKEVTSMEEGEEDDEFWTMLGGKGEYPTVGEIAPPEQLPRLFQISDSVTGGRGITVSEIHEFDQEDLDDDDVMLLDTYKGLYIWIGRNARENEKKEAVELARKYLTELNKQNGRDLETPVATVFSGKEPPTFTCYFLGWDDTRNPEFVDPYKAKLEMLEAEQAEDSELAKLAAERRKKFVDPKTKADNAPVAEPSTPPVESSPPTTEFKFKPLKDFFPLEDLKGMKSEGGIDVTRKEDYLSEEEFEAVFGMNRAKFKELATWRQKAKKQELGLF